MEQNAISSNSKVKSDQEFWSKLKDRYYVKIPELKIFVEGYNKDYIYEKGKNIPIPINLGEEHDKKPFDFKSNGFSEDKKKYISEHNITLLTMRGTIKVNHRKHTGGGDMIADALIEMDYKMILQVKDILFCIIL